MSDETPEDPTTDGNDEARQRMYVFTHVVLRDAAFESHPELVRALWDNEGGPRAYPLIHFWSRTLLLTRDEDVDVWDMFDDVDEDAWTPLGDLELSSYGGGGYTVHVITMPEPRRTTEAYFVAIAVADDDPLTYRGDGGTARYFTLERSDGPDPKLCEWTRSREHFNYGDVSTRDPAAFAAMVREHL